MGFRVSGCGLRVEGEMVPSNVAKPLLVKRGLGFGVCRGTSLIRYSPLLGPYSRPMPRALWWT